MISWLGAGAWVTPSVQARQAYFGRTVTMTRNWAGTISNRSLRSSPILCMMQQPQGQIGLAGSMISSTRGSAAGRLPMVRSGAGLVAPSSAFAARVFFSASTSAKAMDRSSNANCRSSSDSFSDRLPCRAWFNSAIRCSCRRVISVSAATVSINARTAAGCAAGMAERSMAGAVCMGGSYHKSPIKTRQTKRLIHSAAAGGRAFSALTLRQSSLANSASNWAWFSAITPSLIAGQVKVASSSRL